MASKRDIPKTIGLRASSNRTVRLGLIAVGLGTGPALDASARVSGKLHTADGETVKQVYRVEDTGEIVERADLVTMYEHDGALVTLREDEKPYLEGSDTIDLIANLAADEVPSEWITGTNLAWPRDTANDQGYMLLAATLRETGRVLIGRMVDRGTTKVIAVRWSTVYGSLIVQTLAYSAQVREANVQAIRDGIEKIGEPTDEMVAMAGKLLDAVPDYFDWSEVRDEAGEALAKAIAEKAETGAVAVAAPPKATAPSGADDLLAQLKASLEGATA